MTNSKRRYKQKVWKLQVDFFPTDSELIDYLKNNIPIATYIKNLIRADMEKNKKAD